MSAEMNPVGWFEIPVTDMARAKAFYEHVFALELEEHEMGPDVMAWFPMTEGATGATGGSGGSGATGGSIVVTGGTGGTGGSGGSTFEEPGAYCDEMPALPNAPVIDGVVDPGLPPLVDVDPMLPRGCAWSDEDAVVVRHDYRWLPAGSDVQPVARLAVPLADDVTGFVQEVNEDLVPLLGLGQSLPEKGERQDFARLQLVGEEVVAQESDLIAQPCFEGILDLSRRGGGYGVDGQTHTAVPGIQGLIGSLRQPAFDEAAGVAFVNGPQDGEDAVMLGGDFRQLLGRLGLVHRS